MRTTFLRPLCDALFAFGLAFVFFCGQKEVSVELSALGLLKPNVSRVFFAFFFPFSFVCVCVCACVCVLCFAFLPSRCCFHLSPSLSRTVESTRVGCEMNDPRTHLHTRTPIKGKKSHNYALCKTPAKAVGVAPSAFVLKHTCRRTVATTDSHSLRFCSFFSFSLFLVVVVVIIL